MSEQVETIEAVNQEVDLAPEAHEDAGALSFDELDQLTDGRSEETLISENSKTSTPKENKQQLKKEDHDEEADLGAKEEEGEKEVFKEEIKRITAKQGEEDLQLAVNTLFKHKVDGEEVDVDLQELLNNYSGKVSYDKKFQELSSQKKEFESNQSEYKQQIENINKYINGFAEKLKSNDALGALAYFAEFSGMKPHEFQRELLTQIAPEVERRTLMSPDELKAEELHAENKYLQGLQESAQMQIQQQQAISELEEEIASVQEAHGISDEAFNNAYDELVEADYEGDINPQAVAQYYLYNQAFSRADQILLDVDPKLADQEQIVESLQEVIMENPSFDNDDLKEIVQEVYGDMIKKASKTVSKKADASKKQESKPVPVKQDYVDWDDL